jgi:hypothetical protein
MSAKACHKFSGIHKIICEAIGIIGQNDCYDKINSCILSAQL